MKSSLKQQRYTKMSQKVCFHDELISHNDKFGTDACAAQSITQEYKHLDNRTTVAEFKRIGCCVSSVERNFD